MRGKPEEYPATFLMIEYTRRLMETTEKRGKFFDLLSKVEQL